MTCRRSSSRGFAGSHLVIAPAWLIFAGLSPANFPEASSMVNFSCDLRLKAEARISIHAKNTV